LKSIFIPSNFHVFDVKSHFQKLKKTCFTCILKIKQIYLLERGNNHLTEQKYIFFKKSGNKVWKILNSKILSFLHLESSIKVFLNLDFSRNSQKFTSLKEDFFQVNQTILSKIIGTIWSADAVFELRLENFKRNFWFFVESQKLTNDFSLRLKHKNWE